MHLLKIRLCLIFVLLESRFPTCFAITYYYNRRLRNAKIRINTAFFVAKIKYLLKVYGKIELSKNYQPIHLKEIYSYDNT